MATHVENNKTPYLFLKTNSTKLSCNSTCDDIRYLNFDRADKYSSKQFQIGKMEKKYKNN